MPSTNPRSPTAAGLGRTVAATLGAVAATMLTVAAGAALILGAAACFERGSGGSATAGWSGTWTIELGSPGGPLPFELVLDTRAEPPTAVIHNGAERLACPTPEFLDDRVRIRFDRDSTLELRLVEDVALHATWSLYRGEDLPPTKMQGAGRPTRGPRFGAAPTSGSIATRLADRYRVDFESSDDDAVGLFSVGPDGIATGTFLTTTGDYRYLAGAFDGEHLRLSCFDGAHAFLFHAVRDPDGTLAGRFWSRDTWEETWIATPDPEAALPDGFAATTWNAAHEDELAFPDLDGELRRLDDDALTGRAQVLIVFGSWCPNCHDATRLWADLHRRYRDRGLAVVGLAFERTSDLARETPKLRAFVERQGIEFPILICGLADKDAASARLPVLDRVRSFPTTVFRDADGTAVAVHSGFVGPAAPAEHAALVQRFEVLVERLLAD